MFESYSVLYGDSINLPVQSNVMYALKKCQINSITPNQWITSFLNEIDDIVYIHFNFKTFAKVFDMLCLQMTVSFSDKVIHSINAQNATQKEKYTNCSIIHRWIYSLYKFFSNIPSKKYLPNEQVHKW